MNNDNNLNDDLRDAEQEALDNYIQGLKDQMKYQAGVPDMATGPTMWRSPETRYLVTEEPSGGGSLCAYVIWDMDGTDKVLSLIAMNEDEKEVTKGEAIGLAKVMQFI